MAIGWVVHYYLGAPYSILMHVSLYRTRVLLSPTGVRAI